MLTTHQKRHETILIQHEGMPIRHMEATTALSARSHCMSNRVS